MSNPMLPSTTPSDAARRLVRGSYDLHVHVAPDVMRRRITDVDLARAFLGVGLAGFVLKSHYVPTAERAAVVNAAVPGCDALGAIALNSAVGGLNPMAVEIAAREGARVVWMPTVDAANHRQTARDLPAGATPPMWLELQDDLRRRGLDAEPVEVLGTGGNVLPRTRAVLELIAGHGLVLATGHLGRREILAVTRAAVDAGVRQIVITHPEFPQQDLTLDEQKSVVDLGAYLERCLTTPLTGKYPWPEMVSNIRATGVDATIVTTDLGQPHNPPVEDGLALMADAMLAAGFTEKEIQRMTVGNSRLLAGRGEAGPGNQA
ncbi:MAG TPA: DUF6282 family protein [Streptosporangiaceae bacterium]